MKRILVLLVLATMAAVGLNTGVSPAQTVQPKALRVAVATFYSGSGTVTGVPEANFAKMKIAEINKAGGIRGVPIEAQFVDESGGPAKNVTQFRQLAAQHFDAIIGYISSGDCLAIAPVAEELHQLTIFSSCAADSLFQGHHYQYVFRTIPPTSATTVADALYLLTVDPSVKTIAGINPDYAYGRDAWKYFTEAVHALRPDIKPVGDLWPGLFSGKYSDEISRLLALHPDVIYTVLWGGDSVAFIQQANAQGLFTHSKLLFGTVNEAGLAGLKALPEGVLGGSSNTYLFHPGPIAQPGVKQLFAAYRSQFGEDPVDMYAYPIQNSLAVLQAAYAKAMARNGGKWPTAEELSHVVVGLRLNTPFGPLVMRSDHDASYPEEVGTAVHVSQYPFAVFNRIIDFPSAMIQAPVGTTPDNWIATLTPSYLSRVPKPTTYP